MEPENRRDPAARDRTRQRRAQQVQRRRLALGVFVLALIVLIAALVIGLSGGSDDGVASSTTTEAGETTSTTLVAATYTADLTGAESVPALPTKATGSFTLTYDPEAEALTFVLDISGLTSPSVAAVYEGAPGTSGTAVLNLFPGPAKEGLFSGVLAEGTIEEAELTGSLVGGTIGDLIALIKAGDAYVSVGNVSHPVDAIRGQIK